MTLAAGQSLAHYEILGPLGAGAMGVVYRARDTRLDRDVALKVLPEELADDEERLRRFEREAKTLASLNHPNVAQVFGIDQVGDTCFMAMELVPGEDLGQRVSRGALPVDEALDVCRQIAEGIEAAHEAGVIHRDLKPANVVITPEGRVKVLDFGLAKPTGTGTPASSPDDSALTTEAGRLLGTPTYMAPEQARGKPIDRRVDVWALGCVLYECLTGRRAFEGETVGDQLAAVLERDPDLGALPSTTPRRVKELLERCLRKDQRRRMRDAGDVRLLLEEAEPSSTEPGSTSPGGHRRLVALLAVWAVAATVAALLGWTGERPMREDRSRIAGVNNLSNTPVWTAGVSWSPGGERVAYSEMTPNGLDLFVKPVGGGTPNLIATGTGEEMAPRFSPDGATLAYVTSSLAGAPVMLVDAHGQGTARELVKTGLPRLDIAAIAYVLGDRPWSADGRTLLVSIADPKRRLAVHRVELDTFTAVPITFPGPGEMDYHASLSFDGERIVFNRRSRGGGDLWTMPAEGGDPAPLFVDETTSLVPAWRPDDRRVVFVRSTRGGYYDLWEILTDTGELRQITFETRRIWNSSVAADDRIAFCSTDHDTFLHSVARDGGAAPVRLNAHSGDNFGAAPDPRGGRIAYHSNRTGNPEIWLLDLDDGSEVQLTDHPASDMYPDWSPDGRYLAFVSDENGSFQPFVLDVERRTRRRLADVDLSVHGSNLVNSRIFARWSPSSENPKIAFTVSDESGYALWISGVDGDDPHKVLDDVYDFDWYLDSRRGVVTRQRPDFSTDLVAVNLDTHETHTLATIPHTELEVAPDGSAVSFASGPGHLSMNLFVLALEAPSGANGLPRAAGDPKPVTDGEGLWHAHNGGWMPDSRTLVFTRDKDFGDAYELVER